MLQADEDDDEDDDDTAGALSLRRQPFPPSPAVRGEEDRKRMVGGEYDGVGDGDEDVNESDFVHLIRCWIETGGWRGWGRTKKERGMVGEMSG